MPPALASTLTPALTPAATAALAGKGSDASATHAAKTRADKIPADKTRGVAEEFETMFLNSMFQQMFGNVGQGPFSGGPGASVWRSFLTEEYAKSFVKTGGIGIADQVQRELLAQQEAR
jgi:Rod binding domain-containing protein